MATIEKITGKGGTTYRITVYGGFDTSGKRIRHRMTYKPTAGMTARQIEKAAQRILRGLLNRAMLWATTRHLPNMPPMCWTLRSGQVFGLPRWTDTGGYWIG